MYIWRNLDPKMLAAVLLMAARAYQRKTGARRQRLSQGDGQALLDRDEAVHRPPANPEVHHV